MQAVHRILLTVHRAAAAGEIPNHPGVDGAEYGVAGADGVPDHVHVLQKPHDLEGAEVGADGEAAGGDEVVAPAGEVADEAVTDGAGAGVHPHDGVVQGEAGGSAPDDGGLPLVGEADGPEASVDVVASGGGLVEGLRHAHPHALHDLRRVVLHPSAIIIRTTINIT